MTKQRKKKALVFVFVIVKVRVSIKQFLFNSFYKLYTSMRCVAAVSVMFDLYFVLLFINSRAAVGYRHHLVLYHHSLLLD